MQSFAVEVDLDVPPAAAWMVVGDPTAVPRWYPTYIDSTLDGDMRTLTREDGVVIHERVLHRDDEGMSYSYSVVDGLPLAHHRAGFEVHPRDAGSRVRWWTEVEHEDPSVDMEARLRARQEDALQGLKTYVEGGGL
ncbi:MAG TPA: SRPBCC family protein [Miltoncostaeaceae bacterium]|nr:SRPBCC family protein [Miltoncostaeaceae bacterium]